MPPLAAHPSAAPTAPTDPQAARAWRLWPLALLAALLPLLATGLALRLSVEHGFVPACNPFTEGCTSISRAGRHGLSNILFRGLLLPAAVLQAMVWALVPAWLASLGSPARGAGWRALPWLGLLAGIALVVYGTFLGTDGEGYRFMRRYGVAFYFGFTCLAMLITTGRVQALGAAQRPRGFGVLMALVCALPLLGVAHLGLPFVWTGGDPLATKDAIENITEWWAGAIFTAFFFALAALWRRSGFVLAPALTPAAGGRIAG